MQDRVLIGAMSGTSADGVDAAAVCISGSGLEQRATLLGFVECPYSASLRAAIGSIRQSGQSTLADFARLGREISLAYADAVNAVLKKARIPRAEVAAAAVHGQTLFHAPPLTLQWIDPALVAERTGIDVIADFRRADCAAGGQGAPLVPFADYILFRSATTHRVLLNIGGIANITLLPAGCSIKQVRGFDTGPGNCVSDWLMRDQGGVDIDGLLAAQGQCHMTLFPAFFQQPYFQKAPPKSTDGPEMITAFNAAVPAELPLADRLATALGLTVATIEDAIVSATGWNWDDFELIVAGGGYRNRTLMAMLRQQGATLHGTDEFGVPTQAREAMAFAILGAATLDRVPANVLAVTGASEPRVLGAIYPGRRAESAR